MLDVADKSGTVALYYDGDCPFCSQYVRYLRLRESVGAPRLVNLRDVPEKRAELEAEGFDLDRGMVADISGTRYEGADALNALALLSTRSGVFNRITAAVFASPVLSRLAYPVLRAGRNATLTLLGRTPFRADDPGWTALFQVFSLVFGLFAILHFFINVFDYTRFEIYPTSWAILLLGAGLLLFPGSRRVFALLLAAMVLEAWVRAPLQSNHTIMKNFLLLAFIGSGVWHMLRGSRWSEFFRDAVPIGRVLLLVMYFYGVFHKINSGFLDPQISCAVALWDRMPWPIYLLDHPFFHYSAIYGTFVIETVIVVMLLVPRLRHWGIVTGIGFHGFIGLSGFAMYPAFSTLTIALHVLFLSPQQARRIVDGENFQGLIHGLRSWKGALLLPATLLMIGWFALWSNYTMIGLTWLVLVALIAGVILFPGRQVATVPAGSSAPAGPLLWSRLGWLNVIGIFFFVSCATPYMGLKTAQSINMFSNLRLEGGVNNHLLMSAVPMPFGYLDDLVEIREASGDRTLERAVSGNRGLVYYHLLDRLDRSPGATVSFMRDGVEYTGQSAATLRADMDAILHPAWFRKWFHFQWVPFGDPAPC